ncbi:MAG TPA: YraN family protein [Cyclobacteriaceae bacterium]|nr:YraN family protein [Cyclobacteriaceae bacterium]
MTDKIKKGDEGEEMAAQFLQQKGFEILERNYRFKKSEIDLIVRKDNWLVFVEVKLRSSTAFGFPEEFVDYHKKKMIFAGALNYMIENDWQGNVRYDIVAIHLSGTEPDIHHVEDAFY